MRNPAKSEEDCTAEVTSKAAWRAVAVDALPGYRLKVRFQDGTEGTVLLADLIQHEAAGVFAALRDQALFAQATVRSGTVTWPNGLDLAPDAMYDAIRAHGEWRPTPQT